MAKICKTCPVVLNEATAAKKNKKYFRNECKKCHSKRVTKMNTGNPARKKYINEYVRKKGIVKQYPCEWCAKLCYKEYAKAFCSDICRFMSFVHKRDECWIWTGKKNRSGYGCFSIRGLKNGMASRISYMLFKGAIEKGKLVCHTCDIPSCVNPKHLWLGTNADNMLDMVRKKRQNSKFNQEQVLEIRRLWDLGKKQKEIIDIIGIKVVSSSISNIVNKKNWKHI